MRTLASLAILALACVSARADQLIVNGGFENGSLAGWAATTTGGDGGFFASADPYTPLTYNATVGANSGSYYAVSDDYSGSQKYLTQTFQTPAGFQSATLSFAIFVDDIDGAFFGSSGVGGQVSLLSSSGSLTDTLFGPADTFENPGFPNPYVSFSQDIASYLAPNTTYQLQFSSSDSAGLINVGGDDVSLTTTGGAAVTPEPSSLCLLASGGAFVLSFARRRAAAARA